jgi:hypothetical protein
MDWRKMDGGQGEGGWRERRRNEVEKYGWREGKASWIAGKKITDWRDKE